MKKREHDVGCAVNADGMFAMFGCTCGADEHNERVRQWEKEKNGTSTEAQEQASS